MGESNFLYYYPEEITLNVEQEKKTIKEFNESEDILMNIAEIDGRLIASAQISRSKKWKCIIEEMLLLQFWKNFGI